MHWQVSSFKSDPWNMAKRGWVSCFQSYSKYILLEGKEGEWWGRVEKGTFTVFQSEVKLASHFLGKGFKGMYTDFISVIQ